MKKKSYWKNRQENVPFPNDIFPFSFYVSIHLSISLYIYLSVSWKSRVDFDRYKTKYSRIMPEFSIINSSC